jgi:hexosaminidase
MLAAIFLAIQTEPDFYVIPRPVQIEAREGDFIVRSEGPEFLPVEIRHEPNPSKVFFVSGAESEARFLSEAFGGLSTIESTHSQPVAGSFMLAHDANDPQLGEEGYTLHITSRSATIRANTRTGLFRGIQTVKQLRPLMAMYAGPPTLPAVYVRDYPRFSWRGMHLDVGRHMFPLDAIKRYIDTIAHFKMNTFHWHLTEDQGWRLEVRRYPKLSTISAFRDETLGRPGARLPGDGIRYGGTYSQEQVREIVAYAAARHINVVPEIEMPGHSTEVLAAYPELGCDTPENVAALAAGRNPFKVSTVWGVLPDIFCAGKEATFEFIEGVLDETLALFPSKFIHIGGDEAPKTRWENCSACKGRMAVEGLKDAHELQSYFIGRIDRYLTSKGRRLIGWDEILEGGLAENATVMSWRGIEGGIAAANSGHDAVMSPTSHCYLDYYQSRLPGEPEAIGGFLDLATAYSYEPVPSALAADKRHHILGVQGNVWTEYVKDAQQMEYMAWPRGAALAEVGWTPASSKNFDDFQSRWNMTQGWLRAMGVNFFSPRELQPALPATVETTMTALDGKPVLCAFDGNINTQFVTAGGVRAGDTLTITLEKARTVREVEFRFGPIGNKLRGGSIEVSADGSNWVTIATGSGETLSLPKAPRTVKALRLKITADSIHRLIVREVVLDGGRHVR